MFKAYPTLPVIVLSALSVLQTVYSQNLSTSIISEILQQSFIADNVVVSPNLIIEGLWQLYLGADGDTAEQIGKLIHSPQVFKSHAIAEYAKWKKSIAPAEGVTFKTANRIYVSLDINLLPSYRGQSVDIFNSTTEMVDFEDSDNTVHKINNWIAQKTDNKIMQLIDETNSKTKIMLVSAIYFQGLWKHEFKSKIRHKFIIPVYPLTRTQHHIDVVVDMMLTKSFFRYNFIEKLDADSLELEYANSSISMIILLPREIDGIHRVVQNLPKLHIDDIAPKSEEIELTIYLPTFKFEFELDMIKVLKRLGIKDLFDNANMKKMTDYPQQLEVSKFLQKATIEVAEKGTEASAAQFIDISVSFSSPVDSTPVVKVDHPFVFVIKDNYKVYFAGRVMGLESNVLSTV